MTPFTFNAPVLATVVLPLPLWLMPVMLRAMPFVKAIFPLVVLVALKLATLFAPLSVSPVAELVVKRAAVTAPEPLCVIAVVALKPTLFTALIAPVSVMEPVLLTLTLPLPVSLMPVMVKLALFVNATPVAEVSVALKMLMLFAPFRAVPVADVVVTVPVVVIAPVPDSPTDPPEDRVRLCAPPVTGAAKLMLPVPVVFKVGFAPSVTGPL